MAKTRKSRAVSGDQAWQNMVNRQKQMPVETDDEVFRRSEEEDIGVATETPEQHFEPFSDQQPDVLEPVSGVQVPAQANCLPVAPSQANTRLSITVTGGTFVIPCKAVELGADGVCLAVVFSDAPDSAGFIPELGSEVILAFADRRYKCRYPGTSFTRGNEIFVVYIIAD
jgi:hypothetical protein